MKDVRFGNVFILFSQLVHEEPVRKKQFISKLLSKHAAMEALWLFAASDSPRDGVSVP